MIMSQTNCGLNEKGRVWMERSLHDISHVSYLVANMTIIVLAESVELIDGFYFPLETIREGLRKQYYDI